MLGAIWLGVISMAWFCLAYCALLYHSGCGTISDLEHGLLGSGENFPG